MGSFGLVSLPGTLPVQKPGTEDFRPVQDLCAVNSATVTLHPVVPNLYMLLGLIPDEAKFLPAWTLRTHFLASTWPHRVNPSLSSTGKVLVLERRDN
jgi:hypothetical protein